MDVVVVYARECLSALRVHHGGFFFLWPVIFFRFKRSCAMLVDHPRDVSASER